MSYCSIWYFYLITANYLRLKGHSERSRGLCLANRYWHFSNNNKSVCSLCPGRSVKSTATAPSMKTASVPPPTHRQGALLASDFILWPKLDQRRSFHWIWNQGWSVSFNVQLESDFLPLKPSAVRRGPGSEMAPALHIWFLSGPWLQFWRGWTLLPPPQFGEISLGPHILSSH